LRCVIVTGKQNLPPNEGASEEWEGRPEKGINAQKPEVF
jgi:hypothetical protein